MIRVSELGPEDWLVWRELRLRALEESPEAFSSTLAGTLERDARDGEAYWRGYFTRPGPTLVARTPGSDSACGMARLVPDPDPGTPAELLAVWVAPEARGRGAGRALVSACVEWLASHHARTRLRLAVVESNAPARRLYESCGFGVIGRNPEDDAELLMERRAAPMDQRAVELPTALVARCRAVDREIIGTSLLDTPAHLDRLTELIGRDGMRTPIDLAFNTRFATIDGNHRVAVALRLGLVTVPVHLTRRPLTPRPLHARDLDAGDLAVLEAAIGAARSVDFPA